MEDVIKTEGLTKHYGRAVGVEGLDLEVKQGEVFGFLGPNGAGKTTTIRLLLDLIRPTKGRASIFGLDTQRHSIEIKRRLGNLPGELSLYSNLTGEELLTYLASLRGGVDWTYVNELKDRLDIDITRRISAYSHGMKQKLGLIQALMHRPALLILDEPTLGLDPIIQHEFYRLIDEVKAEGRTVFLSSHILQEVERTCDRVGIIRQGHLVAVEEIDILKARAMQQVEIVFAGPVPAEAFGRIPNVRDLSNDGATIRFSVHGHLDEVVKTAARFPIVDFRTREPSLEDVFLAYYSKEKAHAL